jgi:hypothetical protein
MLPESTKRLHASIIRKSLVASDETSISTTVNRLRKAGLNPSEPPRCRWVPEPTVGRAVAGSERAEAAGPRKSSAPERALRMAQMALRWRSGQAAVNSQRRHRSVCDVTSMVLAGILATSKRQLGAVIGPSRRGKWRLNACGPVGSSRSIREQLTPDHWQAARWARMASRRATSRLSWSAQSADQRCAASAHRTTSSPLQQSKFPANRRQFGVRPGNRVAATWVTGSLRNRFATP